MWLKARWLVKWKKRSWDFMMWVMTYEPLLCLFSCPSCFHLFMFAFYMANSQYYLVSLWRKLVSVAAHQCAALTCRAVCRRVDIVASFKLPSVDVRSGRMKHPWMLSVWGCNILVTKGRTLKIRLRMNIVVHLCSVLLLIACCGRSVSL